MCFLQDTIEYMTVCVCVCVNFMKKLFSQSVSEPEFLFSIYSISTDQSKDDSHSETAGDYVLNTLLVCLCVCLSETFLRPYNLHSDQVKHSCHKCNLVEAY